MCYSRLTSSSSRVSWLPGWSVFIHLGILMRQLLDVWHSIRTSKKDLRLRPWSLSTFPEQQRSLYMNTNPGEDKQTNTSFNTLGCDPAGDC